jgi:hypothetical protein
LKFNRIKSLDGCAVSLMKKQISIKKKNEDEKYEKLEGVAIYDEKYATEQVKSVKTRSEGNRFLKNNHL